MTIAYLGNASQGTGSSLSGGVSIGLPIHASGDLIIVVIAIDPYTVDTTSGSAGWTELFDKSRGGEIGLVAYGKIATGSSESLTVTGPADRYAYVGYMIRDHGITDLSDISLNGTYASFLNGNSTSPSTTNITGLTSDNWYGLYFVTADAAASATEPSGWTKTNSISNSSWARIAAAYQPFESSTSVTGGAWTLGASEQWNAVLLAIPSHPPITLPFTDSFNRADDADSLSNDDYIVRRGDWGISSNSLYLSSASGAGYGEFVTLGTGTQNHEIEATLAAASGNETLGLIVRHTNGANYAWVERDATGSTWVAKELVGGVLNTLGNLGTSLATGAGTTLKLRVVGRTLYTWVNGTETNSFTLDAGLTGVNVGFHADPATVGTGYRWDNLTVDNAVIEVSSITSGATVGSPSLSTTVTVSPSSVASTSTLGAPDASPGSVTVSPSGIASTAAVGAPAADPGAVTVSPSSIASSEALGSPTTSTTVTVSPSGIASGASLGAPDISTTATVSPSSITSDATIGSPDISTTVTVSPSSITTGATVGTPDTSTTVTVSPSSITSGEALGSPDISTTVTVSPSSITSGASVGAPSASLPGGGEQTITPSSIASGAQLGSPSVSTTITVSPSSIVSTAEVGSPSTSVGAVTVSPSSLASTESVGTPTTRTVYTVSVSGATTTTTFGTVTVSTRTTVSPSSVASTSVVGSPAASTGAVTISPTGIASTAQVGSPIAGYLITLITAKGLPLTTETELVRAFTAKALDQSTEADGRPAFTARGLP